MTWILLAIIAYLVYALWQSNKAQRTNQLLVAHYMRLIFLLLDELKGEEKELYKQLMRSYVYEHENTPVHEFNQPWEALAEACKIQPVYNSYGGSKTVDKKTVDMIASMLFTNRHIMEDVIKKLPRNLTAKDLEKRVSLGEE